MSDRCFRVGSKGRHRPTNGSNYWIVAVRGAGDIPKLCDNERATNESNKEAESNEEGVGVTEADEEDGDGENCDEARHGNSGTEAIAEGADEDAHEDSAADSDDVRVLDVTLVEPGDGFVISHFSEQGRQGEPAEEGEEEG